MLGERWERGLQTGLQRLGELVEELSVDWEEGTGDNFLFKLLVLEVVKRGKLVEELRVDWEVGESGALEILMEGLAGN